MSSALYCGQIERKCRENTKDDRAYTIKVSIAMGSQCRHSPDWHEILNIPRVRWLLPVSMRSASVWKHK